MVERGGLFRKQRRSWGRRSRVAAMVLIAMLLGVPSALAKPVPLGSGDVLASVGNGKVKHFDSSGNLLGTLDTTTGATTAGMCTDSSGHVFVTDFEKQAISEFDSGANLLAANWVSGYPGQKDESCTVDANDDVYVGGPSYSTIVEYDPSGKQIASFSVAVDSSGTSGTDWVDLASDQCTLFYTDEGSTIKRFNACTNTQMPDFATGLPKPCFELRIRPNAEVLVACGSEVARLDSTGTVIQTYKVSGTTELFSLSLDPDGKTFWTGDDINGGPNGLIAHVDIATGTVLGTFNSSPPKGWGLSGLYLVGGIVVSQTGVTLAPVSQTKAKGATATVTAWLHSGSSGLAGKTILWTVTGANPTTSSGVTDSTGHVQLSYVGTNPGLDTVTACYDANANATCDAGEATAAATVSWLPDDAIIVRPVSVTATEGEGFTGKVVATATDADTASTASEYTASIDWGDGSTSAATITGGGGSFTITGDHTYLDEGTYTTKITATDVDEPANTDTATGTATVLDAALLPTTITPPGVSGRAYTLTEGFVDTNPLATASDFTATIDWGDGGPTSTALVTGGNSLFSLAASHIYAGPGNGGYKVQLHVADDGGSTLDQHTADEVLILKCLEPSEFRWHLLASGDAGHWSPPRQTDCKTSLVDSPPQPIPGDPTVAPGTTIGVGYDFRLPTNKATVHVDVGDPSVTLTLECVSGGTKVDDTVPLPPQTYTVPGHDWEPGSKETDPLTFQGSLTIPDVCNGGMIRLHDGGSFAANVDIYT
jgi:streptogramin lyase